MKLYRLRLGLGIAALFLSAGCYETGAMSVKTRDFFADQPQFSAGEELPPPTKPNTLENVTSPDPTDSKTEAK